MPKALHTYMFSRIHLVFSPILLSLCVRLVGRCFLSAFDFKKVIEIEDTLEKYDCIHYAYQGLGEYDKGNRSNGQHHCKGG